VTVAPRLLTLTDHPGFDLVVIFIHMGRSGQWLLLAIGAGDGSAVFS
jgi:hypothetical protein